MGHRWITLGGTRGTRETIKGFNRKQETLDMASGQLDHLMFLMLSICEIVILEQLGLSMEIELQHQLQVVSTCSLTKTGFNNGYLMNYPTCVYMFINKSIKVPSEVVTCFSISFLLDTTNWLEVLLGVSSLNEKLCHYYQKSRCPVWADDWHW